jgi:hypothetical protein
MSLNLFEKPDGQPPLTDHQFIVKIKVPEGQNPDTVIEAVRRMVGDIQFSTESSEIIATTVSREQLGLLDDAIFKYDLDCVESHPASLVVPK